MGSSFCYKDRVVINQLEDTVPAVLSIELDEQRLRYECEILLVANIDADRLRNAMKNNLCSAGYKAVDIKDPDETAGVFAVLYHSGCKGIMVNTSGSSNESPRGLFTTLVLPHEYSPNAEEIELGDTPAKKIIEIFNAAGRDLESALKKADARIDISALFTELEKARQESVSFYAF